VTDRFKCGRCGMVVSYMPGFGPPGELPSGWIRTGRSLACLACRRERVKREAEREAERKGLNGWRVKQAGAAAAIELEIARTPDASNAAIAARLNLGSANIVRKARQAIEAHRERGTPADGSPRTPHRGDARSPSGAHGGVRSTASEGAG
jgi:hypothetical protein